MKYQLKNLLPARCPERHQPGGKQLIQRHCSRACGQAIPEAAAALALLLPLMFLVIYAVLEMSYAYMLKSSLTAGARSAARSLSIDYGQNPSIASDRSLQDSLVFDSVRINDVINNSAQFADPVFDTASDPPTVSVTVNYDGGQYGLPPFPNPDPLNLGSKFQISGFSTYRLE